MLGVLAWGWRVANPKERDGMTRREAFIALNMLPEIGPGRVRLLMECFPELQECLGAPLEELRRVPRLGEACARVLHQWEEHCDLERELRQARQAGVALVAWEDPSYPPQLREIPDPPVCLYVRGDLLALQQSANSLAMVGTRLATAYGSRMARRLAIQAVRNGWTVVSGLARGVDTICHQATLEAGGRTIAVLGNGLDSVYPVENLELARRIAASGGALVSEFPLGSRPDRHHFPMRNRIISGLSRGTLVVEASLQSGSLITAAQATEQGRIVFAVPGLADSPAARGCHALLKDGARLVEEFSDVQEEFTLLPGLRDSAFQREERRRQEELREAEVPLPPLEYRLWELLGEEERPLDLLVAESGERVSAVLAALLNLEIRQMARQLPGKRVRRVPGRRGVPQAEAPSRPP